MDDLVRSLLAELYRQANERAEWASAVRARLAQMTHEVAGKPPARPQWVCPQCGSKEVAATVPAEGPIQWGCVRCPHTWQQEREITLTPMQEAAGIRVIGSNRPVADVVHREPLATPAPPPADAVIGNRMNPEGISERMDRMAEIVQRLARSEAEASVCADVMDRRMNEVEDQLKRRHRRLDQLEAGLASMRERADRMNRTIDAMCDHLGLGTRVRLTGSDTSDAIGVVTEESKPRLDTIEKRLEALRSRVVDQHGVERVHVVTTRDIPAGTDLYLTAERGAAVTMGEHHTDVGTVLDVEG